MDNRTLILIRIDELHGRKENIIDAITDAQDNGRDCSELWLKLRTATGQIERLCQELDR